jgi:hypothetical protein
MIERSVSLKQVNSPFEKNNILSVQLTIDEFTAMSNVCWDREVRNVSVLEFLRVLNLICETLVSTSEHNSHINLLHLHPLLHVVCGGQNGVEELSKKMS